MEWVLWSTWEKDTQIQFLEKVAKREWNQPRWQTMPALFSVGVCKKWFFPPGHSWWFWWLQIFYFIWPVYYKSFFFFFFFLKEIMWTRFYGGIKNTEIAKWKALNKKIAFRKFIVIWELFTNWDIPALKTDLKLRGTKLQNGSHLENQKLFTFYIGQLLQWGFPDGSGLVKRVILYPF